MSLQSYIIANEWKIQWTYHCTVGKPIQSHFSTPKGVLFTVKPWTHDNHRGKELVSVPPLRLSNTKYSLHQGGVKQCLDEYLLNCFMQLWVEPSTFMSLVWCFNTLLESLSILQSNSWNLVSWSWSLKVSHRIEQPGAWGEGYPSQIEWWSLKNINWMLYTLLHRVVSSGLSTLCIETVPTANLISS